VTGLASMPNPQLEARRLQCLKEAAPQTSTVGFFGFPINRDGPEGQQVPASARALGLTILHAETQANDLMPACPVLTRHHADTFFVPLGSTTYDRQREILEFAAKNRLPARYPFREALATNRLTSYGVTVADVWRRAAGYVAKILKEAKPADLPVEQVSTFELFVNPKIANALGLTVPQSLLTRADHIIEYPPGWTRFHQAPGWRRVYPTPPGRWIHDNTRRAPEDPKLVRSAAGFITSGAEGRMGEGTRCPSRLFTNASNPEVVR